MTKSIPMVVVLATLALTGCMKSYPMWDPPPPQAEPAQPTSVSVEGIVVMVDPDDESFEIETRVNGDDQLVRIELGSTSVVFPEGMRDRAASGSHGAEMLAEDDVVIVSGLQLDDDVIRAREVQIRKRTAQPAQQVMPAPAVPHFEPTERVNGVVRAVDAQAGRIVLELSDYGIVAFFGDSDTPVFYGGRIYQTSNLEIGDDVTVTIGSTDDGDPATPWITKIDVNRSVSQFGAPPVAAIKVPEPPKPDVKLEAFELEGTVKRLETQGFELETEGGALRYVTADLLMPVAPATVERVSDLELGMKIKVRVLQVGERLVAQKIMMLE